MTCSGPQYPFTWIRPELSPLHALCVWTPKGKVQCCQCLPSWDIIADTFLATSLYSFFKKGNPNKLAKGLQKKLAKTTQCLVNKRSHPKSPHPLPCLSLATSAQETLVRWQLYKQHTKQNKTIHKLLEGSQYPLQKLGPQGLWNRVAPLPSLNSGQAQPSRWHQEEIEQMCIACPDQDAVCLSFGVELEAYYDFKKAPEFAPLGDIHKGGSLDPIFLSLEGDALC